MRSQRCLCDFESVDVRRSRDIFYINWSRSLQFLEMISKVFSLVRTSDQNIDRRGILMQILLVAGLNIVLFTSKNTVTNTMSVHRPSADERLLSQTLVPRSTCVYSRYRSRLDHFLMTRSRNSQRTIWGTVIRSNRGGTSTAIKSKRKTKR